jgi:predicted permease
MWKRRRTPEDFSHEVEAHLVLEAERLIGEGMTPADARAAARRAFGNATRRTEDFYESGRVLWFDHLRQDLRCAFRSARRTPIAALVAIASLAGGIGIATATLTLRNALFYNPPPLYVEPSRLSRIAISTPEAQRIWAPGPLYQAWTTVPELRGRIAGAAPAQSIDFKDGERIGSLRVRGVTSGFFEVLGVAALMGRAPSSAPAGEAPPLVLSYPVWQTLFDGRADIVGTSILLGQQAHTIAAVMPQRFWFGSTSAVAWTVLAPAQVASQTGLDTIVRRSAGSTEAGLQQALAAGAEDYLRQRPESSRDLRVHAGGVRSGLGDQMSIVIPWLIGAAVFLTLLIACANVAILMFARWTTRERELAIRSSLGAGRGRVLSLLLTETVLLAICGGVLGICTTFALRGLFLRNAQAAVYYDLTIDYVILLQAAAVTLVAGVLAGIAPALLETRRLHLNPLRTIADSDRSRQRWRHALVVLEISVTVALLVVAASQVDASRRVLTADFGFPIAPLLSARIQNPSGVDVARVLETIGQVPGVLGVASGSAVPFGEGPSDLVTGGSGGPAAQAERVSVTAAYFNALDVAMLAGRDFTDSDMIGLTRVAIVNETLAAQLWADSPATARPLAVGGRTFEVVGVVAAYRNSPFRSPAPRYYLPLSREAKPTTAQVIVRAARDPRELANRIRLEVQRLGATYTVPSAAALADVLEVGSREIFTFAIAMSPLVGVGVFLTATGIFGVLAFAIARRGRELAVRVALGATRRQVARLVVGHTLSLLAVGAIAGVATTYALTRLVATAGGGGGSFTTPGWEAFAIPVCIVLGVGLLATWIPTRRAVRVDPALILKTE